MDKSTLSNYGWIIIVTLILAVMLALATPFGTYVGDGVVAVANSFVKSADNAMDEDNIDTMKSQWEGKLDYSAFEEESDIIPEGAMYLRSVDEIAMNGTTQLHPYLGYNDTDVITLNAGEKFPEQPTLGDIYVDENYVYVYGKRFDTGYWAEINNGNGWNVLYAGGDNTTPTNMLSSVAGVPITHLNHTFNHNRNINFENIVVPQSVVSIYFGFSLYGCDIDFSTVAPDLSKATNLQDISYAFNSSGITGTIEINTNPTSYYSALSGSQITGITGSCPDATKANIMATK